MKFGVALGARFQLFSGFQLPMARFHSAGAGAERRIRILAMKWLNFNF
jgi:hypothetical protein